MMKKLKFLVCVGALAVMSLLTGCVGKNISQGNVGVEYTFTKKIVQEELQPGWHWAVTSEIKEFNVRQNLVTMDNLKPKAADNLSLDDLDVSIYYEFAPNKVADFVTKYKGMTSEDGDGIYIPGSVMVENQARGVIYDAVSHYDSLNIHKNREALSSDVVKKLQAKLDAEAPGYFTIKQATIRALTTDKQLESSIVKAIEAQKEIETATQKVKVQQQLAAANKALSESLTPAFLQHEYNQALMACAQRDKCTLIVDGSRGGTMINLNK